LPPRKYKEMVPAHRAVDAEVLAVSRVELVDRETVRPADLVGDAGA
jgi:hypothetical protein